MAGLGRVAGPLLEWRGSKGKGKGRGTRGGLGFSSQGTLMHEALLEQGKKVPFSKKTHSVIWNLTPKELGRAKNNAFIKIKQPKLNFLQIPHWTQLPW